MIRKFAAAFLGTAILVFFAVGVATLMFGFRLAGSSIAAGVVATALAFGLALLALVYMIGPISGSHVNPAVTAGALLTGRIPLVGGVLAAGLHRLLYREENIRLAAESQPPGGAAGRAA
jgi:aquaporin Z